MFASLACWSTLSSDLLSMAAMISALTPWVIRFSICETWFSGVVLAVDQLGLVALGLQLLDDVVAVGDPALGGLGRHRDADGALLLRLAATAGPAVLRGVPAATGQREHGGQPDHGETRQSSTHGLLLERHRHTSV